jgi:hypothetical protein
MDLKKNVSTTSQKANASKASLCSKKQHKNGPPVALTHHLTLPHSYEHLDSHRKERKGYNTRMKRRAE